MGEVVLASEGARTACTKMKQIIDGQLLQTIQDLYAQGEILANNADWKGPRARRFQGDWPGMKRSLDDARKSIEELRRQADDITRNIMVAGGCGG